MTRNFTSNVFRELTYTSLILTPPPPPPPPPKWKFGLIQCLVHTAYTISSSWLKFSQEVDFPKSVFSQNGYPEALPTSCLRQFMNNKCGGNTSNAEIKVDRAEAIFFILYIGLPSIIFSSKHKELFKKYYCINIRVDFTSFKAKIIFH